MDVLDYAAFSSALQSRQGALRLPLNGTIEVTRRCPLVCGHCYNNLPMGDSEARARELSYEEHCRLLDELAEAGCLWLLYTGGEIFARRDFLEIYTYAKKKGFLITLFTNGTLITERIADHLVAWRPFAIEITLYGASKQTYEQLTGVPGSYEKCLRGIQLLKERGLPLALKTVAVSINRDELRDMQAFADDLGVAFKFDSMINPRLDCSMGPAALRLTPEESVALDLQDPRRADEWVRFADHVRTALDAAPPSETVYQCGGGINAFAIDPYGRLSICVLSEREKVDVRAGRFREGWNGFLRQAREKKITRQTKCVACTLKPACGMCPANGELEHADQETPVDYLCHTAHLRAYALGLAVTPHGECEYCAGGARHDELVEAAARLRENPLVPHQVVQEHEGKLFLRVVDTSRSGGCSSCGSH